MLKFALGVTIFLVAVRPAVSQTDSVRQVGKEEEVTVTAERPFSAASDKTFRQSDFELRPRNSAQDMLRLVPGLMIAQHAGGGKAEQIFLRGFDADHGTDVNISVDDAPVNMVSHGHGQGYADLHFVIPETVQEVDVVKGPYFARYGDLATAGVVAFSSKDSIAKNLLKLEGGAFDFYRAVALVRGPSTGSLSSYFGAELTSSRGYFDLAQDFKRLNLFAKATAPVGEEGKLSTELLAFTSGWRANGQIPERAIDEGLISRFGSLDSTEGGATSRTTALVQYTSGGSSPFTFTGSYTDYRFRLFSDFTFFLEHPTAGDEIEQTDSRSIISIRGERLLPWIWGDAVMKTRIGATLRNDDISAAIYHDSSRVRLSTTVDAQVEERQIGPYVEQEVGLSFAQVLVGLRADYVSVDVANRLDPSAQPNGILQQLVLSPKANLRVPLGSQATAFANFGYGFHSNDARAMVQARGENALPRAVGGELGLRYGAPQDLISGSFALWRLDLESELVWSGDEGTTEGSGRTRREGVDLELRCVPTSWLTLGGDATLSRGRFIDEPLGEDYIPLAPNLTLTANAQVHFAPFAAALRLRHVGDRPANETNSVVANGYSIVDLSASYVLGPCELFLTVENLLNSEWNEAQFNTESRIYSHGSLEREPVSELHFTAGTPRALHVGLSFGF